MEPVPKIGDKHHFFDDGKIRESRHYVAEVLSVLTPDEAQSIIFKRVEYYNNRSYTFLQSLYSRWIEEVNDHRQGEYPCILVDSNHYKPDAPWLYEETTDYFIECNIPNYDTNSVWFVRTIDGGWFSIDTTNSCMSGRLMPIDFNWD